MVVTKPQRLIQHTTDFPRFRRGGGNWTLCGKPLPPYLVGPAVICEDCSEERRRRRAMGRKERTRQRSMGRKR